MANKAETSKNYPRVKVRFYEMEKVIVENKRHFDKIRSDEVKYIEQEMDNIMKIITKASESK